MAPSWNLCLSGIHHRGWWLTFLFILTIGLASCKEPESEPLPVESELPLPPYISFWEGMDYLDRRLEKLEPGTPAWHREVLNFSSAFILRVNSDMPMHCNRHGQWRRLSLEQEWELFQNHLYGGVCDKFAATHASVLQGFRIPSAWVNFRVMGADSALVYHTVTLFREKGQLYFVDPDHGRLFFFAEKDELIPVPELFARVAAGRKEQIRVEYQPSLSQVLSFGKDPEGGNQFLKWGTARVYRCRNPYPGLYLQVGVRDCEVLRATWGEMFENSPEGLELFRKENLEICTGNRELCGELYRVVGLEFGGRLDGGEGVDF